MDTATQILRNGFPTTVAAKGQDGLTQHFLHSKSEFDLFFDEMVDKKNLYMNIARFRQDMRPVTGDFPFDFDSPMKESAFEEDISDRMKIKKMRQNDDLAQLVLGDVWDDVQRLVEYCQKEAIPILSVFSGLGVHCHLLFQEQVNPVKEKTTTTKHIIDELDLSTYDRQIITDTKRVLRVPNSKRFDDGKDCNVYCIPMTELEVLNNSLHDMLDRCKEPKYIEYDGRYAPENRPEMQTYDDVKADEKTVGTVQISENKEVPDDIETLVKPCIGLPCVRERFFGSNPDHKIRFAGVAHLYQSGFTPQEVRQVISRIGWIDYDESITKKMTDSIWNNRYSEMSCSSLRTHGLCVYGPDFQDRSNDPSDCETYKYTSGETLYPW
jgi:hypothetical protein